MALVNNSYYYFKKTKQNKIVQRILHANLIKMCNVQRTELPNSKIKQCQDSIPISFTLQVVTTFVNQIFQI